MKVYNIVYNYIINQSFENNQTYDIYTKATSYFEWTEEQSSFEMTSILIMTMSDLEDLGIFKPQKAR